MNNRFALVRNSVDRFWGPARLLFSGSRCFLPGESGKSVKMKTLPPAEVKNEWSCSSNPLYAVMHWTETNIFLLIRVIWGYYKINRHFQRYVVSKPLAQWTHNLCSSVEERWKFFPMYSFVTSAPHQRPWHHWSKMAATMVQKDFVCWN
jgi:hypothetical protein